MTTTKELIEKLVGSLREVPDVTEIVELAAPNPEALIRRNEALLAGFADATGRPARPGQERPAQGAHGLPVRGRRPRGHRSTPPAR